MIILKDVGIDISYEYSLENKKTARCPEQIVCRDKNENRYLVVHAKTHLQSFYSQRAIEKQKEIASIIPAGMEINFPIYNEKKEDGYYTVYPYYQTKGKVGQDVPDKWIRKVYKQCSKNYLITTDIIEKIEKDLLSVWPQEYHQRIIALSNFKRLHACLQKMKNVDICFQHGDFTTNNILMRSNGTIYLLDFEFSTSFQPIGFDLFDYHYSSDKQYNDIPYLEFNQIKEDLINEVNYIIDSEYKPIVCDNENGKVLERFWADDMIYNRPDLFVEQNSYVIYIKYGQVYYIVRYSVSGYKATLCVWLRMLPAAVVDEAVAYILKKHYQVQKINIDYASVNVRNQLSMDNNWVIFLPEKAEDVFERLGSKSKYNFRRERKQLIETLGEIHFNKYMESIPEDILEIYFEWKRKTHGTHYNMTGKQYLKKYHVTGGMTLSAGNNIVSILFFCINESTVYLENISYDTEFHKYSPGFILYEYFLEEMTKDGLKVVFLGNGNQLYKSRFRSIEYITYSGTIYRNGAIKLLNLMKKKINKEGKT